MQSILSYTKFNILINWYVFLDGGSFGSMLQAIGGRMTEEAFELVLKNFDLDVRYPVSLCEIYLSLYSFQQK